MPQVPFNGRYVQLKVVMLYMLYVCVPLWYMCTSTSILYVNQCRTRACIVPMAYVPVAYIQASCTCVLPMVYVYTFKHPVHIRSGFRCFSGRAMHVSCRVCVLGRGVLRAQGLTELLHSPRRVEIGVRRTGPCQPSTRQEKWKHVRLAWARTDSM